MGRQLPDRLDCSLLLKDKHQGPEGEWQVQAERTEGERALKSLPGNTPESLLPAGAARAKQMTTITELF